MFNVEEYFRDRKIYDKIVSKIKKNFNDKLNKKVGAIMELNKDNLFIVTCIEHDMFNNRYLYNDLDESIQKSPISIYELSDLKIIYSDFVEK